jgi:hypothetical protein
MCGSHFLTDSIKQQCIDKGYILDNTGNNISKMNPIFGDLTGLYWVWKNTNDEFVGTNQYRRFYSESQINSFLPLDKNTLYVAHFLICQSNLWDQYISSHGPIGIKILSEASRMKKIPITKDMIDSMYQHKLVSPCNMFFGHRYIFDLVCKVFFEIIFELYQGTKYTLNLIQDGVHSGRSFNDKRLLAFLGERILNILYFYSSHFFGNIHIQPIKHGEKINDSL